MHGIRGVKAEVCIRTGGNEIIAVIFFPFSPRVVGRAKDIGC